LLINTILPELHLVGLLYIIATYCLLRVACEVIFTNMAATQIFKVISEKTERFQNLHLNIKYLTAIKYNNINPKQVEVNSAQ